MLMLSVYVQIHLFSITNMEGPVNWREDMSLSERLAVINRL